jgi:predicted DsbA family dithiol-disulfide isomerase
MRVEIYSDVACPWCYVGHHRFEQALGGFPHRGEVEAVYRPFQLDPAAPARAVPLVEYLERRFGAQAAAKMRQVAGAAEPDGITFAWDDALAVNTLDAHRLAWLAAGEYGPALQRALMHALFAAHFAGGEDLSDHGTLVRIAAAAGMDRERVLAFLVGQEGREEVARQFEDARRLGIQGVPTYVFDGRFALSGARPAAAFSRAFVEAWALRQTVD